MSSRLTRIASVTGIAGLALGTVLLITHANAHASAPASLPATAAAAALNSFTLGPDGAKVHVTGRW